MDNLQLAVNRALHDYQISRLRQSLLGGGSLDGKRPQSWCEYGFPDNIGFGDLYGLYRRGGIAHGAVNKLIGTCWRSMPWVIEGDEADKDADPTQWENKIKPLFKGGAFWRAFREADRRRLVGRYSALLLQLGDNKKWHEPVKGQAPLLKMIPVWESSLKPASVDNLGTVQTWTYTYGGRDGLPGGSSTIHPDRIFILGDHGPDAIGFLEPAYNNFISLEKVEGGSGESFLKNAARQLNVNFDKEVNLDTIASMYGVSLDELQVRFNEAAREVNRANDLLFITQGATTTPLVSSVPDPRPTFDINLQAASAALDIPSRILVGNQQGERASTEDQKYFNGRCQSRRNELSPEIADLLNHLIRIKVIPVKDEFTVMWDDLTELETSAKLGNAKTMAEINNSALDIAGMTFSIDEIRGAAGYDPVEESEPLPDDEDQDLDP